MRTQRRFWTPSILKREALCSSRPYIVKILHFQPDLSLFKADDSRVRRVERTDHFYNTLPIDRMREFQFRFGNICSSHGDLFSFNSTECYAKYKSGILLIRSLLSLMPYYFRPEVIMAPHRFRCDGKDSVLVSNCIIHCFEYRSHFLL